MKGKRLFSLLIAAALAFALLPGAALAAEVGDFVVSGNAEGYSFDAPSGTLTFTEPGSYMIAMKDGVTTTTSCKIRVDGGSDAVGPVLLTFYNVSIQSAACALDVTGSSFAIIFITGTNTFVSGADNPGIRCAAGARVQFVAAGQPGTCLITAQGGVNGAGIGGGNGEDGGDIWIQDGIITANGINGAGIGGGNGGDGGSVFISTGTITAAGTGGGAGIGGGIGGDGGEVYIDGGSVSATAGAGAQRIGAGQGGAAGTLETREDEGVAVYRTVVTLAGAGAAPIDSVDMDADYPYSTGHMYSDGDGKIYLYLPVSTETVEVNLQSGGSYVGSVVTTNDHLAQGTLTLSALPRLGGMTNPVWHETTPGLATWEAVENAAGYTLKLYKNNQKQGDAINVAAGVTQYDLNAAMAALGGGEYSFKVAPKGDGASYRDGYAMISGPYTYSSQQSGSGNDGGSDNTPVSRILMSSNTGIAVSGSISPDAELTIGDMALGSGSAHKTIRKWVNNKNYILLAGRDISLSGSFTGELTISIPVGAQYNGRTVTVLHAKKDGTLATYTVKVADGKVTFKVTSLSPFAVFASASGVEPPQTGGENMLPAGLGLLTLGALGVLLALRRRSRRA